MGIDSPRQPLKACVLDGRVCERSSSFGFSAMGWTSKCTLHPGANASGDLSAMAAYACCLKQHLIAIGDDAVEAQIHVSSGSFRKIAVQISLRCCPLCWCFLAISQVAASSSSIHESFRQGLATLATSMTVTGLHAALSSHI